MLTPATALARSAPWVGVDFKGQQCTGADTNRWYGPYDYTIPDQKAHLRVVNEHHFTPNVENHIKGQEAPINADLNYTLMAGPNHHPALLSIINLQVKLNKNIISTKRIQDKENFLLATPVECYFQRAINFSPEDAATYSLYGYYLKQTNRLDEAKKFYEKALKLQPQSAKIAYAYGLLLIELKEYDKALENAKLAYQNRQAPPGLRNKLKSLGKWID